MINIQNINQKKVNIDSARLGSGPTFNFYTPERTGLKSKNESVLFSRDGITNRFFTEDSKLYITPKEMKMIEAGFRLDRRTKKWDSLSNRIVKNYQKQKNLRASSRTSTDRLYEKFVEYRSRVSEDIREKSRDFWSQWSLREVWNFSLIGAVLIGMVSMTFIYRVLGPGASAGNVVQNPEITGNMIAASPSISLIPEVMGMEMKNDEDGMEEVTEKIEEIVTNLENAKKEEYEKEMRSMVKGYPIEKMLPNILEKDRIVAAFLVSIAKKESNWGKRVPILNGQDCYNYWGYRGQRKLMGTGGHTCFNSRKDAVDTVAKRLETLIKKNKLDTPDKLVIWKCGSACHKDNPQAVRKWISDVHMYFEKLNK